jgi:hypothetical protein
MPMDMKRESFRRFGVDEALISELAEVCGSSRRSSTGCSSDFSRR